MPLKLRKNTMPRRFAPRLFLTISQKVKIGGVFWTKFEHFLTKIPIPTFSMPVGRQAPRPLPPANFEEVCAQNRKIFSTFF
jgi:hypothetical protein